MQLDALRLNNARRWPSLRKCWNRGIPELVRVGRLPILHFFETLRINDSPAAVPEPVTFLQRWPLRPRGKLSIALLTGGLDTRLWQAASYRQCKRAHGAQQPVA